MAQAAAVDVEVRFQDGIQSGVGELQMPGVLPGASFFRMRSVSHVSVCRPQAVLEKADETGRGGIVAEVSAHRGDVVIIEPQGGPGVEMNQVEGFPIGFRGGDDCIRHLGGDEGFFLFGQFFRHAVAMHGPDVHFHGFGSLRLEDGGTFRGHRIEPKRIPMPEIIRSTVTGIR